MMKEYVPFIFLVLGLLLIIDIVRATLKLLFNYKWQSEGGNFMNIVSMYKLSLLSFLLLLLFVFFVLPGIEAS